MIWCPSKVDVHGCKIQNKLNWSSPCNQAYMFPLKICGRLWFDCLLPTVKSDNESNPKARESFRCLKHTKINVLLVALPDFSKPFLAERNDQRSLKFFYKQPCEGEFPKRIGKPELRSETLALSRQPDSRWSTRRAEHRFWTTDQTFSQEEVSCKKLNSPRYRS
ncbi:hypothetical protein SDJN03_19121, partial [Cucurbita argyrosperma subsp. sororia]